jgi:hypothetical protein
VRCLLLLLLRGDCCCFAFLCGELLLLRGDLGPLLLLAIKLAFEVAVVVVAVVVMLSASISSSSGGNIHCNAGSSDGIHDSAGTGTLFCHTA